jgi:hypothetical protein
LVIIDNVSMMARLDLPPPRLPIVAVTEPRM